VSSGASPLSGCIVAREKITDYLLEATHPVGRGKAAFFGALGFSRQDWRALASALGEHPSRNPIERTSQTPFGSKHVVRCTFESPDGRNPCIVTVWMRDGTAPARLVTAYPA
jgi:hypothetical protein